MKKPVFQWETQTLRARRSKEPPGGAWEDDPRAEQFELECADAPGEPVGSGLGVTLGSRRQRVERELFDDELLLAIRCWLAARGVRATHVEDERGQVLQAGPFRLADLGRPGVAGAPCHRLVTLAPSCAETVDALGCFDRVVACEDSSDHPPEVERCERLGPDLGPDLDRIAALNPDLVVSSLTVPGMERNVTGLAARGVPQWVSAPRSLGDVQSELLALAAALGVPERGEQVVARMQAQMRELEGRRRNAPVRVYLEWWPRPMFTPGKDCYSNELIALAGGVNVFGERAGSSLQIEPDELLQAAPDICFVSWCGVKEAKLDPSNLIERPGLERLDAARQGRVFALDEAFSGRPGPRMLEAAQRMRAAMVQAGLILD